MVFLAVTLRGERASPAAQGIGTTKLYVDDGVADEGPMRTLSLQFSLCGEGLTVGRDGGDRVSRDYPTEFPFTGGTIKQVVFDVADDSYLDVERVIAAGMSRD